MTNGTLTVAEHGLIGDLRTSALVGTDGTIDWFCAPRFDSPSVFGAILDPQKGGAWTLSPATAVTRTQQFYYPDTAILITRFLTDDGVAEVHDFMQVPTRDDVRHRQRLVRRVSGVRGTLRLQMCVDARPDYARYSCSAERSGDGVLITGDGVRLGLTASTDLHIEKGTENSVVTAEFVLSAGDSALFVLEVLGDDDEVTADSVECTDALLESTTSFWRDWLSQSTYTGRWREVVHRSAITLKLLTHEPSGAIIAAPTTSLPAPVGGSRNWDYRYVWIRDAGFSLYALLRLGFLQEARQFIRWLSERMGSADKSGHTDDRRLGPLRVLYDIDGNLPQESELDHLSGHRNSTPVRIGNAAAGQLQLDIYGEIIDSVYLFNKYGPGISHDAWTDITGIVDWVAENWDRSDAGMWEVRADDKPYTTSRLMCWVAIERAIRIARARGLPGDLVAWSKARDDIYQRIMTNCWNEELQAFTRTEGDAALDAGVLLMPMLKFLSPADPRFLSTLAAIEKQLVTDSLVFRYEPGTDGLDGQEGTFSICSFWYVEALTRAGRLQDAQLALEKMFTYANHIGLYAEQISATGDQMGNFPQAFTHLALISAATNLDRALNT
ncbi:glycoside hydrolase family 15 protein [Mycobacteroides chelonae]|uniref:glycoside hydrolase family 15 protein n=1 Tax=Mycobacteroides chelonae TaxID=1774 RepID=UPI0008A922A8|nr:glycoside hydrolase family 15 protein [Mycobacteroides chelonae]OHU63614.1 glucoamylase [Mycobacteroides chelonae]